MSQIYVNNRDALHFTWLWIKMSMMIFLVWSAALTRNTVWVVSSTCWGFFNGPNTPTLILKFTLKNNRILLNTTLEQRAFTLVLVFSSMVTVLPLWFILCHKTCQRTFSLDIFKGKRLICKNIIIALSIRFGLIFIKLKIFLYLNQNYDTFIPNI